MIVGEVLGVDRSALGDGIGSGPLPGLVLGHVDFGHDRVGAGGGRDLVPLDDEDAGEIAAVDGLHGQVHHRLQGIDGAAGREQGPGRVGEAGGEFRGALVRGAGTLSADHGFLDRQMDVQTRTLSGTQLTMRWESAQ